jgi:hypothetical protein
VVLAATYRLFEAWIGSDEREPSPASVADASGPSKRDKE